MGATGSITAQDCGDALAALRERVPLVQCLTNIVAAQWTANVLLAVGAAPAMVDNPHEAADFATIATGVLVNLGTPYDDTATAMQRAVTAAVAHGTPWVLDPVAAGALEWRTGLARELLVRGRPAIIRGNASEILALTGGTGGKGVDSVDSPEAALPSAGEVARAHRTVVAVSGQVDHLTDGDRVIRVDNGHPLLTKVTGVGCALGALMAAFAGTVADPLLAAAAATATLTVAAESAAGITSPGAVTARRTGRVAATNGPGSFAVALLDELAALTADALAEHTMVS